MPRTPPEGVERVLARADSDPAFREALLARRSAAALEAGFELTPSERAVLDAIDERQLDSMLDALALRTARPRAGAEIDLPGPVKGIRPGLPLAVAAGAVVLGGTLLSATCLTHGARPDVPPPRMEKPDAGTEQDGGD